MSPEEELSWIQEYMANLYAGVDLPAQQFHLTALPFEAPDLVQGLHALYGRTSVPPHVAPSFVWKALATSIGSLVFGWVKLMGAHSSRMAERMGCSSAQTEQTTG